MKRDSQEAVSRLVANGRRKRLQFFFGVLLIGVGLIALRRRLELPPVPDWFFLILLTGMCAWAVSTWVVDHGARRKCLVVVPRDSLALLRAGLGAVMLILGLLYLSSYLREERRFTPLWMAPYGLWFLLWGLGRTRLLEKGIWRDWSLVRWSKFRSFHWEKRSPSIRILHLERDSWMFPRWTLRIPTELQPKVTAVLEERGVRRPDSRIAVS